MAASQASPDQSKNASQEFLDSKQYARKSVEKYERIFGTDFVSTGGVTTTAHFCDRIFGGLADKYGCNNPGPYKILDIGCGIGGSAFYMAKNYNVSSVLGIDLSSNMVNIGNEKIAAYKAAAAAAAQSAAKDTTGTDTATEESKNKEDSGNGDWVNNVELVIGDALKQEYEEGTFDLIYSRDTILHIFEKSKLFSLCYKWLKPNGMLFVSDYCCSKHELHSDKFKEYIKKRGYYLHTPMEYGKIIGDCGFERVTVEDRTQHMISILKAEKGKFEEIKDVFVKDFSEDDYNDILNGWLSKIERCGKGEQRWATFMAMKKVTFDE